MGWLGKIVESLGEDFVNGRRKNATPDNIRFVPRNNTAFAGDTIFYARNTSKGLVSMYGTVTGMDGDKVLFTENNDESKKPHFIAYNSKNLFHCAAWLKPVKDSGAWAFDTTEYHVGYETSSNLQLVNKHRPKPEDEKVGVPDGVLMVTINWITRGYKEYYRHDNGEFVGAVNVKAMHKSKTVWAGKKGEAEPMKVYSDRYDASQYVVIPEEFQDDCVLLVGTKAAWNFRRVLGIGYVCPWLRDMKAPWSEPGSNRIANINPFELPQVKAKMRK